MVYIAHINSVNMSDDEIMTHFKNEAQSYIDNNRGEILFNKLLYLEEELIENDGWLGHDGMIQYHAYDTVFRFHYFKKES